MSLFFNKQIDAGPAAPARIATMAFAARTA